MISHCRTFSTSLKKAQSKHIHEGEITLSKFIFNIYIYIYIYIYIKIFTWQTFSFNDAPPPFSPDFLLVESPDKSPDKESLLSFSPTPKT